jgi:hypothetical protein
MAEDENNPRPWRKIAYELSKEDDAEKIIALSIELNRAFEDQKQMEKGATPISRGKASPRDRKLPT